MLVGGFSDHLCEEIESYKDMYTEDVPVRFSDVKDEFDEGDTLAENEIDTVIEEVATFYDELLQLDVDEEQVEDMKANAVYNPSKAFKKEETKRILKREMVDSCGGPMGGYAGSGMLVLTGDAAVDLSEWVPMGIVGGITIGALGVAGMCGVGNTARNGYIQDLWSDNVGGTYFSGERKIGVASDPISKPNAYRVTASEVFHYLQYAHESDTRDHEYLHEGLERASTFKAVDHFYKNDTGDITEKQRDALYTHILTNGYLARIKEIEVDGLMNVMSLPDINTFEHGIYYGECDDPREYDIGASNVLYADRLHENVFPRTFEGDYSALRMCSGWINE